MKKKRLFKRIIFKNGIISASHVLYHGNYGIFSKENYLISSQEIECCRVLMRRELKKKGKIYIKPVFDIPLTKKASGVRMGKGKGPIKSYKSCLKINQCLFEFMAPSLKISLKILKKLSYKLPIALYLYSLTTKKKFLIKS